MNHLTLVVGGTGKTGRRVAERLIALGRPVRVGSRGGEPPFDWENRGTWEAALSGASAAYVSYHPDLAAPGARDAVAELAELAVANGTRRLVLLSGRGEEEAQLAEQALQASGADWTIVRCSWFMQNFSESFLLDSVLGGQVALPVGAVREPFVDVEDIADVAVTALTEDGHVGELYELTGPRLMTFEQAVSEIAEVSGHAVIFTQVSLGDYAEALRRDGLPEGVIALITYLFTEVLDGRNSHLSDGVERALRRPPRDFTEFARRTASSGVWSARNTT